MEHDDLNLFEEDSRFVNILASSPTAPTSTTATSTDDSIPRSRSVVRARRSFILPALSTSPTGTPSSNAMEHVSPSVSTQPSTSPLVNNTESTPLPTTHTCTVSTPIMIPNNNNLSKNKVPTAKDLETQCSKSQETGQSIDISDFECSLCFRVFFQPVTTVCGHVFCKQCLFSALKYSLQCPLCRHKLEQCSSVQFKYSVNVVLMNMIEKYFPKELKERVDEEGQWQKSEISATKQHEEEAIVARPPSPSWSCILPSLRSTCNVILSCGGF